MRLSDKWAAYLNYSLADDEIDIDTIYKNAGFKSEKEFNDVSPQEIISCKKQSAIKAVKFVYAFRLQQLIKGSQKAVASSCNISESTLSEQCKGKTEARISSLAKLASQLNVSTDYLLGRTKYKTVGGTKLSACRYTKLDDDAVETLHDLDQVQSEILSYLLSSGELVKLLDTLQKAIINTIQFEMLYDTENNTYQNDQLNALEYHFTKDLSYLYRSTVENFELNNSAIIGSIRNSRSKLKETAQLVKEKMDVVINANEDDVFDSLIENYFDKKRVQEAQRILELLENAKKNPSAQ